MKCEIMLGDLFNNNKRKDVCTREGQRFYLGVKYSVEAGTGYLVSTTTMGGKRRRLHVVMWEHEAGREVPPGCVIHHVDWNKGHNTVDNLVCVTIEEHEKIHNIIGDEAGKKFGEKIKKERGLGVPPEL